MIKNRFYFFSIVFFLFALTWILCIVWGSLDVTVCFIQHLYGIPCPSCGSTRSLLSIFKGEFAAAFFFNPLGYLYALAILIAPPWFVYDFVTQQNTAEQAFHKLSTWIAQKPIAIIFILLLMANWIWNFYKYL